MPIFNIDSGITEGEIEAQKLLSLLDEQINSRISIHLKGFKRFWYPKETTVDKIAEAMGTDGGLFLLLSRESIRHLITGITICNLDVQKYFPENLYTPPREIDINLDGTLKIGPRIIEPFETNRIELNTFLSISDDNELEGFSKFDVDLFTDFEFSIIPIFEVDLYHDVSFIDLELTTTNVNFPFPYSGFY